MKCFFPKPAWYSKTKAANGGFAITFKIAEAQTDYQILVPCGGCLGCRMTRKMDWAMRISHEARYHQKSMFLTLTFRPSDLPLDNSLSKGIMQKYIQDLRNYARGERISYFLAGEYAPGKKKNPQTGIPFPGRPHYHLIILGAEFDDQVSIDTGSKGDTVYTSADCEKLWPYGNNYIGKVTPASAAYCAGYIVDKMTGPLGELHYVTDDPEEGLLNIEPEFQLQSTRPALGKSWFDEYHADIQKGFITDKGQKREVPRAYERWLEQYFPENYDEYLERKMDAVDLRDPDNKPARLAVQKECAQRRINKSKQSKLIRG